MAIIFSLYTLIISSTNICTFEYLVILMYITYTLYRTNVLEINTNTIIILTFFLNNIQKRVVI
jgi:hypothetical protein